MAKERCLGSEAEYKSCRFYVETKEGKEKRRGLLDAARPKPAILQNLRPYPPIHLIHAKPRIDCPFAKVYNYGGGYLVYCEVASRLLTRSEAEKCSRYWSTCPFYKMGVKMKAEHLL